MSVTRRGGDFWWLQCDGCNAEHHQLPDLKGFGQLVSARAAAIRVCAEPRALWRAGTKENVHVGPSCLSKAREQQLRSA